MSRMPELEDFETATADPRTDRNCPGEDWLDGHAQGFAEGCAHGAAVQGQLSAEIAQTLADMAFGYAEARTHLLQSLKPLFAALIGKVLPALADAAHAGQVMTLLQEAAAQDSHLPLELSVHPDRIRGLTALLPHAVGLPIILVADTAVARDAALLKSTRGETALDLGAVTAGAAAALAAIFATDAERASHG